MSHQLHRAYRFSHVLKRFAVLAILFASSPSAFAQSPVATGSSKYFELLSVTPSEVVVRIAPQYQTYTVVGTTGQAFTEVTVRGGSATDSVGAPELMRLELPLLAPNRNPATIEVLDQKLDVIPNIDLAPVPSYTKSDGDYRAQYSIISERYFAPRAFELFSAQPIRLFRTAYMERVVVNPIQYDANSRTLTRLRSLTLRIRLGSALSASQSVTPVSRSEAELYRSIFVNGSEAELYRAAEHEWTSARPLGQTGHKALAASDGQWLQVETTDEGIYRISAQDLANAGITGAIDTGSIELFGVGGDMLSERVTSSTGEWLACPFELHLQNGQFRDLYFYAPGVTVWKYSGEELNVDGLYHTINPYTSTGHFLLKVGGNRLGPALRVQLGPDSLSGTPEPRNYVFSAISHEVESQLENLYNWGRELLGEKITRSDVGPLQISINPPGYLPDSTTIRVAYDANISTAIQNAGSVAVTINGQQVGTVPASTIPLGAVLVRNWDNAQTVPPSLGSGPFNVGLTFASSDISAWARLDFIEFMYRRSTTVGSAEIPFFILNTKQAFTTQFQNAAGGELWDVTSGTIPRVLATATGDVLAADMQGISGKMRRLIACSPQSMLTAKLTKTSTPTLRETIGQTGAEEIILAPNDLLSQAQKLRALREQGGDATEAMSAAVVNIEDVYREFGYGSRDLTAIRDFMSYTLRHGTTNKVHYLLLLGGGHCDYQQRIASIPNYIPVYEVLPAQNLASYREQAPSDPFPFPDDSYYGRLVDSTAANGRIIDVAVGRVSARTPDDADAFVSKAIHYEHSSDSGSWRSIATFLADDRIYDQQDCDPIDHLGDSEAEEKELQDRLLVRKIYDVSYPVQQTSNGRKQPEVEQAIIAAMNQGNVLFSFIGHGNPNVWTHEGVLNVPSTIDKFNNFDRLPYLTTATCDFSEYDNFAAPVAGGVQFLLKPDGGAIGLLGTSRSVTGGDPLPTAFYSRLFGPSPESGFGTSSVGDALIYGKLMCTSENLPIYFLLGDPAQRLLLPGRYVSFDSLNGTSLTSNAIQLPALSQARISGRILLGDGTALRPDGTFNGTVTITLYDAPTEEHATTVCPGTGRIWPDAYSVEGPILYRGVATVRNGQFSATFIVPKDVKLDSLPAKLSGYAFSDDGRSALGDMHNLQLVAPTTRADVGDTAGPALAVYIGTRAFRSGDAVSKHSTAIVDINTLHGLNTSTASVGHSFVAWVDAAQDSAIDMASTYVSKQDDYRSGTSVHPIELPAGHHTLHVRAFDTYDNPSFASVDFVAMNEDPYHLYQVSVWPDPLFDHTTFSFTQPGHAGSLVEITLSIYTPDARQMRTITMQTRESAIDIPWDGRDNAGNTVANGVYVFSIAARNLDDGTSTEATGKCVVAR
ncbi:MAG: type IX secretion system sortase PorU [Bacteroidota bacterium]|nr:type IX secretion system sortase PorU [Bacteroidota bacterium]MDP4232332.1 type IX secretion system sortase PorU [Bacteroidota bacterium]MDP4241471.1 type IX secretion system sortase PorU [Bacteroidota bacterium]MDP4286705.1 type IX secretion system sortase PorU [Bacteroidota bacterium]